MSTTTLRRDDGPGDTPGPEGPGGGAVAPRTTVTGRLRALGRAELTLLVRNRTALFSALVIPIALTFAVRSVVADMDLSGTGLSTGTVLLPGAIGFVLLFAVYANLVGTYVVRREELVLKRLRTGEPGDAEILAGAALPAVVIALAQCVLLVVGGAALLDLAAPESPELLVLGLLLGLAFTAIAAAATAAFTGSAEGAQLTPMPLMMVSFILCGVFVPLDLLPDGVAAVAEWLPVTPVMELLRGGWTGGTDGGEALQALGVAVAWTALAGWVVRKRFRWEPRR
ncbi:ABC transporter permease [Streptomyces sp. JJ36]|uniref:ABC transporter permease n=1 Tax=Streptomyces sp. JJ36 TaxID=2736645 RepID=UPI001F25CD9A|nr:ABC transporter permease [Streptomyces sp. JJ36]MCF6523593.1 ABC transporter permease [Streptomyces sp. JJ36]